MITWFRNLLEGWGKWVFIALVVVAFAAFGNFDFQGFTAQNAIEVGDRGYSAAELDQAFAQRFAAAQADNPQLTRAEAIERGLLQATIATLSTRALVQQEAERLGLTATDPMIQEAIRSSGAFEDPSTGEFSARLLQLGLQNARISPQDFREDVRADVVQEQLVSALSATSPAPAGMTRLLVLRAGESRTLRTATLTAEDTPEPSQEELLSFYAANAERYAVPELRRYRALVIDAETLADQVEVPDAEVRQLFESRAATLGQAELRSFRQAVFSDAEQAQQAAQRVAEGESLRAVTEEMGVSSTRFEDQPRAAILDATVAEAVFGAGEPGVVGPVRGTFGTVVAEVEAITPGSEVVFEDVEEELRASLREERLRNAAFDAVEEVERAFDEGATLEEAAEAAGLPAPRRYGPVDADLFTPEGAIETAPGAVQRAAFTLGEGDESEAIALDDGGYAFVFVDQVSPEAPRPFEDVRERVARDYADQAQGEALEAAAEGYAARVRAGEAFEAVAEALGVEVEEASVSLRAPDPAVPAALLRAAFDAAPGEVVSAPSGDGVVLAVVDAIRFAPDPNGDSLLPSYRAQVGQELTGELLDAYLAALRETYGVTRDDAVIAQQFGLAE